MGLIERSIRKRGNQKLAAEVYTQTTLSFDDVVRVVEEYCNAENMEVTRRHEEYAANANSRFAKWNASVHDPRNHHYYVSPHSEARQILIGFGQQPEPILAGRANVNRGVWAARISYPPDGSTVGISLLKWVIGGNDGAIKNRTYYEKLLENLHGQISSDGDLTDGGEAADSLPEPIPPQPPEGGSAIATEPAGPIPGASGVPADSRPLAPDDVTAPQKVQVGTWLTDVAASLPFLGRDDVLAMVGMRAVLSVDTGYHSSTYITKGSYTTAQFYDMSTHSLLNCRWFGPGPTYLSCGAPSPGGSFATDWQLKYAVSEAGEATIEVPLSRKVNGAIRSGELLIRMREAVKATLTYGIHLRLEDGPPSFADLLVTMPGGGRGYPDNDKSPFDHDFIGGVNDSHRTPLQVPAGAREAVLAAAAARQLRSEPGSGDVISVTDLAGARPSGLGSLTYRQAGEHDQFVIDIPAALEPLERERSFRVAVRFLAGIALELKDSHSEVSESIYAQLRQLQADVRQGWVTAAGTRQKDRPAGLWMSNWDKNTPAPMMPVAAGRWYPIGVRVSTNRETRYLSRAIAAADWTNVFKRLRPQLGPNGRPTGRSGFYTRRCGMLYNANDKLTACLRFASSADITEQATPKVTNEQAWFWEVTARGKSIVDTVSSEGGQLLVTGWSHADGVLGYGQDLLLMLQAFAYVISTADPEARIQTLYLAT